MTATNGTGWCVEAFYQVSGWRRATVVFATQEEAVEALELWQGQGVEIRVYEVLGEKA